MAWLIVDAQERPDLAQQVRAGTLHQVTCPHCNTEVGWLDAPILYHDAEQELVVFAPSQRTSRSRDARDLNRLIDRLHDVLPDGEERSYLQQPMVIPNLLLAPYLRGGQAELERALDHMWEESLEQFAPHVQEALRVLRDARVETMEQLEAFLAEHPDLRGPLEEAGIATSQLQQDLLEFVRAETWRDSREWLEDHPELLSPEAEEELSRMFEWAQQREEETAVILEEHRDLLRRCRTVGIKTAFLEKATGLPAEEAMQTMSTALDELLALDPEEVGKLQDLLERYPFLLGGEGLAHLSDRIDALRAASREEEATLAQDRWDLLDFIRQSNFRPNP